MRHRCGACDAAATSRVAPAHKHNSIWPRHKRSHENVAGSKRRCDLAALRTDVFSLRCAARLPQGSSLERITAFFVGGAPRLRMEEVVHTPGDRFRLQTTAGGAVHLRLGGRR